MLRGLMMDRPLMVSHLISLAADVHHEQEIVSSTVEGGLHRYGYPDAAKRIARLANALIAMGIRPGDRVATLAWNGYRHFELYFAISGIGAVCHTINPRLFPEQIVYIASHAADRVLFYDATFAPFIPKLRPKLPKDMRCVAMADREHMPAVEGLEDSLCYEDLLAAASDTFEWPEFDENAAAGLCYTSGTTGEPKGALYSHRSHVLHALFVVASMPKLFHSGARILPVVPLFHVNAWGLPYAAPLAGVSLVFPGPRLDGASLFDLMEREQVHSSWGVPSVWLGLIDEMRRRGRKPAGLEHVVIGGSAAPRPMIEAFEREFGVDVVHAWGMTEMSPIGTVAELTPRQKALPLDERITLKLSQGHRVFGVETKIVDDEGRRQPHDGAAIGELFVRGPAVIAGYFDNEAASRRAIDGEGWFGTGDVARITSDGFLHLVDRTKDLVKSGGEWISSIEIESVAAACEGVAACAVIGAAHDKWLERPLLIVVARPGVRPTREAILARIAETVARWQVPDDVIFVDSLPMTATGKVSKLTLRTMYGEHYRMGAGQPAA